MGEDSFEQLGVRVREESNKEEKKVLCLVASMEIIDLLQMQRKIRQAVAERISSSCTPRDQPLLSYRLSSGTCHRNQVPPRQEQGPWAPHLRASGHGHTDTCALSSES